MRSPYTFWNVNIFSRQHPHGVVAGKDTNELMMNVHVNQRKLVAFRDIGIVCVRKEDIVKSLEEKRKKNIDPTNGKFVLN